VGNRKNRPALLGVTVLTSFDAGTLQQIGMEGSLESRVLALAQMAKDAGLDGVVASAYEAPAVRRQFGPEFKILVPGVRPAASGVNDQSRVATPGDAVRAGADYLVVGRPITAAKNPREAALAIAKEISAGSSGRSTGPGKTKTASA
jgi:orotidine-5'-phosphate decarboxylase